MSYRILNQRRVWNARIVHYEELTEAESHQWMLACARSERFRSPFYSPAFTAAVARIHPNVRIALLERDGKLVAVFPFQYAGFVRKVLGAAERVGGNMSDHCGVIAFEDFHMLPRELLQLTRLNSFEYEFLDHGQALYGLCDGRETFGLRIDLQRGGEAYWEHLNTLNRHFTAGVERGQRQLISKFGPINFVYQVKVSEREAEFSRLIKVKGEQYNRTGGVNLLESGWRRYLLEYLLSSTERQCTGVLSTLYAGDTWVASHFGIRSETSFHYWFPTYNTEMTRWSPGHILLKYLIRNAEYQNIFEIDLGGDGRYKHSYRPEIYSMFSGFWWDSNVLGFINKTSRSLVWRISATLSAISGKSK